MAKEPKLKEPRPFRYKVAVQPDGGLCGTLRRDRRLETARLCVVALTNEGLDYWGQYHGRTGIPLYALEYSDKEIVFLRRKSLIQFCRELRRMYPKGRITIENIRGLNPHPRREFEAWPDTFKQLEMFPDDTRRLSDAAFEADRLQHNQARTDSDGRARRAGEESSDDQS